MDILFLVGISGSGKSSFAELFLQKHSNYIRINRDDIRKTLVKDLNGYYQRKDLKKLENIVNNITNQIVHNAVSINYNLIIDNTNLNHTYIKDLIELVGFKLIDFMGFECEIPNFSFKFFDCDVNIAKERVAKRDFDGYMDKTEYIEKQYAQYQQVKKYITEHYANIVK